MKIDKSCASCSVSVFCPTWGEWKCITRELRYSRPVANCMDFSKRPANWKEHRCQCEDCLKNDALAEEYMEERT